MKQYTYENTGAFVKTFELKYPISGELDGLTFAVKDNIHVKGYKTSYGSKPWLNAHPVEVVNAVCVDQLLNAGATCLGKTVSDEFTSSLDGESYFYGTPLNPKAPEHIPGGSSSGSASAVACGLVDFALGTDNAGSIRVPASLCGIWGMRPTTHRVSEAGVLPFVPSVSTTGILASTLDSLAKATRVLLSSQAEKEIEITKIYLLKDVFDIACCEVKDALQPLLTRLAQNRIQIENISLSDILGSDITLYQCNEDVLRIVQSIEVWNSIGSWIKINNPEMGARAHMGLKDIEALERSSVINHAYVKYEEIYLKLKEFIKPGELFCYPTVPVITPAKNQLDTFEQAMKFYQPTMAVTAFAGIGKLPEITVPGATWNSLPIGLSITAGTYQDEFLLKAAQILFT